MKCFGIDFETANNFNSTPCSVGIYLKNFTTSEVLCDREILINPDDEFSWSNINIHKIYPHMVENAPLFPDVFDYIISLIDDDTLVLAHNAPFDINVLLKSCDRYHLKKPSFKFMDTLALSRRMIKKLKSYSLSNVAAFLKLPEFLHHNASEDSKTCMLIFESLMKTGNFSSYSDLADAVGLSVGIVDGDKYLPCKTIKNCKNVFAPLSAE